MKQFVILSMLATAAAVFSVPAGASYVYSYTGHTFTSFGSSGTTPPNPYDDTMAVTISFEVENLLEPNRPIGPDLLVPLDASFSDGLVTIDRSNATAFFIGIATDATGAISAWDLFAFTSAAVPIGDSFHVISSSFGPDATFENYDYARTSYCLLQTDLGTCLGDDFNEAISEPPGTWTVSQVPLPAALWLFATSVAALFGLRRARAFPGAA